MRDLDQFSAGPELINKMPELHCIRYIKRGKPINTLSIIYWVGLFYKKRSEILNYGPIIENLIDIFMLVISMNYYHD